MLWFAEEPSSVSGVAGVVGGGANIFLEMLAILADSSSSSVVAFLFLVLGGVVNDRELDTEPQDRELSTSLPGQEVARRKSLHVMRSAFVTRGRAGKRPRL